MSDMKYIDLKYDDETLTIEEFLRKEKLPAIVRICDTKKKTTQIDITQGQEMLLQQTSKELFAHIKVLQFYDNEKMQTQKGAEYVYEHETYVGNEYLMPLKFPGCVKLVRRPGTRGRYLTIKQVISDCPAFVKVEQDTEAFLAKNMEQTVTIKAKTILEFKNAHQDSLACCIYAEFKEGNNIYTFSGNDIVDFTVVEKDTLYSLEALPELDLLPKVILFKDITPYNINVKDNTSRSAISTIVEGPIEILGFVYVINLTCWTRNHHLKTYETALIPKCLWNKVHVQKRSSFNEEERKRNLSRKFGQCLRTTFISKSLYLLQFSIPEVTWLRCPDFFTHHLEGNTLYDVTKVPFYDSSDDDHIYQDIEETIPKFPERRKSRQYKQANSKEIVEAEKASKIVRTKLETRKGYLQRPLSSIPKILNEDKKYTQLEFSKPPRVYESLDMYGDSLPLGYSKKIHEKAKHYLEARQIKKVLQDNQTEEDFYNYSVKEVSFCFEHCGMKNLAEMCHEKKLDGPFFKGFSDWKELNLSKLDIIILNKMIYEGWRSKDDSTHAISTQV